MKFKKLILKVIIASLGIVACNSLSAQQIDKIYLQKDWRADWIKVPKTGDNDYGVYYFRKQVTFQNISTTCPVYVSADNCYKLYVNQKLVSTGPAKGDTKHWNYETVDLAPYLKVGDNIVAALVWNDGEYRPTANISLKTAFILQAGIDQGRVLNTGSSWVCIQDTGYSPIKIDLPLTSYKMGPGEFIDMNKTIRNWNDTDCDVTNWMKPEKLGKGNSYKFGVINNNYLQPSELPQMELTDQRISKLRMSEGINVPEDFPVKKQNITIPSNSKVTFILDQTYLTNAYLNLEFSDGENAQITVEYCETLYEKYPLSKGNRNEIEGKEFKGRMDRIISNGANNQKFTTLFFRTFRYLKVEIETQGKALVLNNIYSTFTGYPFVKRFNLDTENKELKEILAIGWRTSRLCAFDTYFDCPYYEQLQYIGDTQIQALISVFNSGDSRLFRNAINLIDQSRSTEGITLSRYPAGEEQVIGIYSVWYIAMLNDYLMYCNDSNFVKDKLLGARQIINYYKKHQQADGSVINLPGWLFTDWTKSTNWTLGVCKLGGDGCSSLLDLQLLYAYEQMVNLEKDIGINDFEDIYTKEIEKLKKTIRNKYWDNKVGLFADRVEKDGFSQHANILAILTGVVSGDEAKKIAEKILTDKTLAQASIYFKYYLHQALTKAGMGDKYLEWLDVWRDNIKMGLTTWAETSDLNASRSDCHAWGASPNIEFFRTVLGIDSDAPGFTKVKIEPHLGKLTEIGGEMPHPNGIIKVNYSLLKNSLKADIVLPSNTSGRFIWKGKEILLNEGENHLKL